MRPRRMSRGDRDAYATRDDLMITEDDLPGPRARGRRWARLIRRRDASLLRRARRASQYAYGESYCLDCDWTNTLPGRASTEARRHAKATAHSVMGPCGSPASGHHRWSRHTTTTVDGKPEPHGWTHTEWAAARQAGRAIVTRVTRATCMFCGRPHPRPSVFDDMPWGLGMGVA